MAKFAFILHPLSLEDMRHLSPLFRFVPGRLIEAGLVRKRPFVVSRVTGVTSSSGATTEGWFIGCPLTARQMLTLPEDFVLGRIIEAGHLAEKLGAEIVGLGAFTSIVGDAGLTVAKALKIAVTSGNSYTVATAVEGALEAAREMQLDLAAAHVLVVGATGSVGRATARIVAQCVPHLTLVARDAACLAAVAATIRRESACQVEIATEITTALAHADLIFTVTSSLDYLVPPKALKPGAVICDVARPRNVARSVTEARKDILVIEGGLISVPGAVDFHFDFGFPRGTAYACMAETMLLALANRLENFSLGRELEPAKVREIAALAAEHGFRLAGLRNYERAVTSEKIAAVRLEAARAKAQMARRR